MFMRKAMERVRKVYWIPYTFTSHACFTHWSWPPQVGYPHDCKRKWHLYQWFIMYLIRGNYFQPLVAFGMDAAWCVMEGGWKHATCRSDTSRFILAETKLITVIKRHYHDNKWALFTVIKICIHTPLICCLPLYGALYRFLFWSF